MTTTPRNHRQRSARASRTHRPPGAAVGRPFHTPVRGHAFARCPPGGARLAGSRLVLRREQGNPADPWAIAVWAEDGGVPWRVGYLERAVAARLGPHLDRGPGVAPCAVPAVFAGWSPAPGGRWQRPLVRVGTDTADPRALPSVRELPPFRHVRTPGVRRG